MPSKTITILLADDQLLFLDALEVLLKEEAALKIIGKAKNGKELIRHCEQLQPDIILTDIQMPELDGIEATRIIRNEHPEINIIGLTSFPNYDLITELIDAGAKSCLLKTTTKEEVVTAIHTVLQGKLYFPAYLAQNLLNGMVHKNHLRRLFTDKDLGILKLICKQYSSKEIAHLYNLPIKTIEITRERLQKKAKAKNVVGLILYALKEGVVSMEEMNVLME